MKVIFLLLLAVTQIFGTFLQLPFGSLKLRIDPYGTDSLRVRVGPQILDGLPGALINSKYDGPISILPISRQITNGNLRAKVDSSGLITFTRVSDNKVLLKETSRTFAPFAVVPGSYAWNNTYASDHNEAIYGLGQHETGRLNNKNQTFDFKHCLIYDLSLGAQIMIPFYISNRGYGYLWNLPSFGHFASNDTRTEWTSESAFQLDFWVTTSEKGSANPAADILSNYVDTTGHSPKLPRFASGFWQSKNRYRNQTDLLLASRGHIERGIPISLIVVDNIRNVPYGDFSFNFRNSICFPNPKEMTDELSNMGIETMVSVWPLVQINSTNIANFSDHIVKCPTMADTCVIPGLPLYLIDATKKVARDIWWKFIETNFINNGVNNFFLDSAEPVQLSISPRHVYSIGAEETVGMLYPFYYGQVFGDGFKANKINGVSLIRSAWAGSQRTGAAVWSGDTQSNFATLRKQVRVGLNMQMSGVAWWTSDIGGYQNGDIYTDEFRELIVRWFQWGAFCPIFRNHGFRSPLTNTDNEDCRRSGSPNEIWNFGNESFAAIKTVILIREQIREYINEHLEITAFNGTPIMRPLWFDFPLDPGCADIEDQLMFGPKYMVAPITEYLQRNRTVYFPSGTWKTQKVWVHWFTYEEYAPGTTAVVDAPLATFPLFYLHSKY